MYYVYSTYLIGRKKVIKDEEGFFPRPSSWCEKPLLHLHERCLESNLGFATGKNKILEFSYYPNEEFGFKNSYACISTTSVGATFCLLTLTQIETKRDGKPP